MCFAHRSASSIQSYDKLYWQHRRVRLRRFADVHHLITELPKA
jgi:hypothetical protein